MAHFAEIDENGKVLRVVVACNQDIINHGGELSEEASEYFKKICPLSINGVKWIQTSYNSNFRKQFAGKDYVYNSVKDKFILPKPYSTWILNENDDWIPPFSAPITYTLNLKDDNNNPTPDGYKWDENVNNWIISPPTPFNNIIKPNN